MTRRSPKSFIYLAAPRYIFVVKYVFFSGNNLYYRGIFFSQRHLLYSLHLANLLHVTNWDRSPGIKTKTKTKMAVGLTVVSFQGSSKFGFLANDSLWRELVPQEGEPHLQFQWAHWFSSLSSFLLIMIIIIISMYNSLNRREDDAVITIYVLWLHLIFVTIIPVCFLTYVSRFTKYIFYCFLFPSINICESTHWHLFQHTKAFGAIAPSSVVAQVYFSGCATHLAQQNHL